MMFTIYFIPTASQSYFWETCSLIVLAKSLKSLVAEAVRCERVSPYKFPAIRENNREF